MQPANRPLGRVLRGPRGYSGARGPRGAPGPSVAPVYGSFSSDLTQGLTPGVPLPLVLTTQDVISPTGLAVTLPSPSIAVTATGVYKVLASVQFTKTTGGNGVVDLFPTVNGVAVPNSATRLAIRPSEEDIMTIEWLLRLTLGQGVSIVVYSADTGIQATAFSAMPSVPAVPSIITTIVRIE